MMCKVQTSDALAIRLVISIGHYQPLFLVLVSYLDIVISVLIMSFFVIITSLITFMILIIIEKMLIFIDRNQKAHVDIIQCIRSVSDIGTYLKQLSVYRNIGKISYQSITSTSTCTSTNIHVSTTCTN